MRMVGCYCGLWMEIERNFFSLAIIRMQRLIRFQPLTICQDDGIQDPETMKKGMSFTLVQNRKFAYVPNIAVVLLTG